MSTAFYAHYRQGRAGKWGCTPIIWQNYRQICFFLYKFEIVWAVSLLACANVNLQVVAIEVRKNKPCSFTRLRFHEVLLRSSREVRLYVHKQILYFCVSLMIFFLFDRPCGCGSGDSGCSECGVCRICAGEFAHDPDRASEGANGKILEMLARTKEMIPLDILFGKNILK